MDNSISWCMGTGFKANLGKRLKWGKDTIVNIEWRSGLELSNWDSRLHLCSNSISENG